MVKAKRPVFIPKPGEGLAKELSVEFEWFRGFAVKQKQRCIRSLHQAAHNEHHLSRILEVSTKSLERLGGLLSAFNLRVRCEAHPDPILLEAAFQGSKVFRNAGGPFLEDLISLRSGGEVKRYMKEFAHDQLTGFQFNGTKWPLAPKTAFYDWLYIRALRELDGREEIDDRPLPVPSFHGYRIQSQEVCELSGTVVCPTRCSASTGRPGLFRSRGQTGRVSQHAQAARLR